jgi:hypothetical protein
VHDIADHGMHPTGVATGAHAKAPRARHMRAAIIECTRPSLQRLADERPRLASVLQ